MKKISKFLSFVIAIVMCATSVIPAYAATSNQDNLSVIFDILNDSYSAEDTITGTITLKNTSETDKVTNVSLEGIIPENSGYTLQWEEGQSAEIGTLEPKEEKTLNLSFVPKTTPESTPDVKEGTKIFETDFEEKNPFTVKNNQNTITTQVTSEAGHGTVVEYKRTEGNTSDFYMDYSGVGKDTAYVVYEFDIKLLDKENTAFQVMLKDGSSWWNVIKFEDNTTKANGVSSELMTIENNTWYTVAVACDYLQRTFDIYLNGNKIEKGSGLNLSAIFNEGKTTAAGVQLLRFYAKGTGTIDHLMIDNVRVYEGTKPYAGELMEPAREKIVIDYDKSIFIREKLDTSTFPEMLDGYISLHTRNGMVYYNGIWTRLATMPIGTEAETLVVAEELCEVLKDALNITYSVNGNNITINDKEATVTEKDGVLWINAKYFFETILGKQVAIDTKAKSDGMMIAGDTMFTFPSAELFYPNVVSNLRSALQNLNDYLFFDRPSYDKIQEEYEESALYQKHPRIMASKEDFENIKRSTESNPYMSRWYQQMLIEADLLVEDNNTPLKYEVTAQGLLEVANRALANMTILGMAYQLTGDEKYAERAWIDLEAISNFKNWCADHPLDVGTFCAAAAIGYDWMYDAFSDEQRAMIEEAMYYNGYTLACNEYMGYGTLLYRTVASYNQCAIINCGFAMAGLAFMDVYPEESAYIVSNAIKGADINLTEFAPDGAYSEGAGYWAYVMSSIAKLLASLEKVFGTCYSLDLCEGLSTTAEYMLNVQTDLGIFNYNDSTQQFYYAPEFYYLSDKYDDPSISSAMLYVYGGKLMGSAEPADLALSLLYLDPDVKVEEASLPKLDKAYWGEGLVTLRDKWSKENVTFVGIHGGYNQIIHGQLDAGTFIYDYAGVRWIKELGKTPYNIDGVAGDYTGNGRWRLFRSKAEAHNTLVIINEDWEATGTDQVVSAGATLKKFESDNTSAITVIDLYDVYAQWATKADRGFFFTDSRNSLVVRDEISLLKESTVYSFFLTDAVVEIAEDGKSAILTQNGTQMKLEFKEEGSMEKASLGVGPATREMIGSTSPTDAPISDNDNFYDVEDAGVNRIYVKLEKASGNVAITVKLTPVGVKSSSIDEYAASIDTWVLRGGEIESKPELMSVTMNGRDMMFNSSNTATFLSVEGRDENVPEAIVKVDESKYTYQVTNAESTDGGTTYIVVSDKADPSVFTRYAVNFVKILEPKEFEGMTSLQIVNVEASDEPQGASDGHYRWCVLDNNTVTRWTAQGSGNWILLELEEETTIDNLMIAFYNPTKKERGAYFGISVSKDGENWDLVWSGISDKSAVNGDYQQYKLGGKTAKYIRLDCNGNTAQGTTAGWNNIAEIVFTQNGEKQDIEPTPTPEAPTSTPTPEVPTSTPSEPIVSLEIITEGTDTSYTQGTNVTSSIHCTGEVKNLVSVKMDGQEVDKDNYTVKEGSTIVTFKTNYLESLSPGEHTVTLGYFDGNSINTLLVIIASAGKDAEDTRDDMESGERTANEEDATQPMNEVETSNLNTGDNSHMFLFIVLAATAATIAIRYRNRLKGIVFGLLVCVLMAGMVSGTLQVQAEGSQSADAKLLEVSETVTVGENTLNFGVKVTYTIEAGTTEGDTTAAAYENLIAAYANYQKLNLDFNNCTAGTDVHDSENIPDGAYYFAVANAGTIQYAGANGYIQFANGGSGLDDRVDIQIKHLIAGMKYVLLEYKVGYKEDNAKLELQGRGSVQAGIIGSFDNGVLKDYQGNVLAQGLEKDKLYKLTYVFNIDNKKCDVYLDGVKLTQEAVAYHRYFDQITDKASFRFYGYNSGIMLDDIKVYGSETNPNAGGETDYSTVMAAYANYQKLNLDFNNCTAGTDVHDSENIPDGAYYFAVANAGTIQYARTNGYIQFADGGSGLDDRVDIQIKHLIAGMKYVLLEYKVGYKEDNAKLELQGRGSEKAGIIGSFDNGVLKDYQGNVLAQGLEKDKLYKLTYVFDIDNKKCDVYLDGVKLTQKAVAYHKYFDQITDKASFRFYGYNSGIMLDDIKVYGSTTDPMKTTE